MKKILLVEDDIQFQESVKEYLEYKNFLVVTANDGRQAKECLLKTSFDLVISDIQMKNCDGIELLKWSKKERPVSFILMTGYSKLLETASAFDLAADNFLEKPFNSVELLSVIEKTLNVQKIEFGTTKVLKEKFCKIPIDEFVSRPDVSINLYVKVGEEKFIKVANGGRPFDVQRLQVYKEKGLRYVYVKNSEMNKLIELNLQIASLLNKKVEVSFEKKAHFMQYTAEVILEKCFIDGIDRKILGEATDILNSYINVVTSSRNTENVLSILNTHADFIYAQSVCSTIYAILIARKMGITSDDDLKNLAIAGLFQDIGKNEMDRSILEKRREDLTRRERVLLESHVVRGCEILESIGGFSKDIIQIVYEHHEDNSGSGYPRGLRKKQLNKLSMILIGAIHFSELVIKNPYRVDVMSGEDAVNHLERYCRNRLSEDVLAALREIVSFEDKIGVDPVESDILTSAG